MTSYYKKAALWTAAVILPVGWLTIFLMNYSLVPAACAGGSSTILHLTAFIGLAGATFGALLALRLWRHSGGSWPDDQTGEAPRNRFIASGALLLNSFVGLIIISHWLIVALVDPCVR
jgi:hypothetical protein